MNITIASRIDRDRLNKAYSGKIAELISLLPGGSMDVIVISRPWLSGLAALEAERVITELARVLCSGGVLIAVPDPAEDVLLSECWQLRLRQFAWAGWEISSSHFVASLMQQRVDLLTIKDENYADVEEWQQNLLTGLRGLPPDQLAVGFPTNCAVLCCETPEVLVYAARRGLAVVGLFEDAQQAETLNKVLPAPQYEQQAEQS